MNGCLIPDTPIVVDLWRRGNNPSHKHFFLSHMHSDHTQGLSASWRWPIYCSPLSAKMLVEKFQIREQLIRPLDLDQSHLIKLDRSGKEMMTVTLFDANHCPGSVMFLFEGYFGRILYTGDFRYEPSTYPETFLSPGRPVDKLYLDNTFNNPRCRFPTRSECREQILNILEEYPDHDVVLGVYTLGKEDLLVDIALALGTRVVVTPARMRMLQVLELLDVFTTDKDEGHVRLVPRQTISKKNMANWNREAPTIAIIPTGLFSSLDGQPYINQDDVFVIPYSDHSSYPELRQFVSRVCPRSIIPIVKDSIRSSHPVADMHNFDDLLDRSPSAPFDIPTSVLRSLFADNHFRPQDCRRDLDKMIPLRRIHSQSHRRNQAAKGVIFLEDDEQEQNHPTSPTEHMNSSVSLQQHQLAESESNADIINVNAPSPDLAPSPEKIVSNIEAAPFGENVSSSVCSSEVKTSPGRVSKPCKNTTQLKTETKALQAKCVHGVSSANERNPTPQGVTVAETNAVAKTRKRQHDELVEDECLGTQSRLFSGTSNKRPRILPSFSGPISRPVQHVKSGPSIEAGEKSAARSILDFFKGLGEAVSKSQQAGSRGRTSAKFPCKTESTPNPSRSTDRPTSMTSNGEKAAAVEIVSPAAPHARHTDKIPVKRPANDRASHAMSSVHFGCINVRPFKRPTKHQVDKLLAKRPVDDQPSHFMSLAHFRRINVRPIKKQTIGLHGLGDACRR